MFSRTHKARLAALLRADLSLYVSHLPLDAHPEVGNNAVLARLIGIEDREPFGSWGDRTIGVIGRLPEPIDRASLAARIASLYICFIDERDPAIRIFHGERQLDLYEWWARQWVGEDRLAELRDPDEIDRLVELLSAES